MSLAFEMAAVNNSILALVNPHNESLVGQAGDDQDDDEDHSNDDQQQSINAAADQRKQQQNITTSEQLRQTDSKRDFRMYSS